MTAAEKDGENILFVVLLLFDKMDIAKLHGSAADNQRASREFYISKPPSSK